MKDEPTKRQLVNGKWQLDYGMDDTGKQIRRTFGAEKDLDEVLDAYKKDAKKSGDYFARLRPARRLVIAATLTDMDTAGVKVEDVWSEYRKFQAENMHTAVTPMPYAKVVEGWENTKTEADKGTRYVHEAANMLRRFGEGQEKRMFHTITTPELQKWINAQRTPAGEKWSKSTKKTNQGVFSSLWKVAISNGWASVNITERLEQIGHIGFATNIYPNESTRNIMASLMSNELTKMVLVPFTLGFFGCMRPEEVESEKAKAAGLPLEKWFGWPDIDLVNGLIRVRVEIAKKGDERTIRLQPNAVSWLKLAKELKCPLPSVNLRRLRGMILETIGLDEEDWIRDGLRKNCATHLRAVYKNDHDVIMDMGNSVRILLKHYAAKHVPPATSLEHWEITPDSIEAYLKTEKWRELLISVAAKRARLANGTATPEN
jgi:hypothetical protein